MGYTLGLDIGSSSIGWALLSERSIIKAGVRVFPEGVDRDTKGAEVSKNAARREARGARKIKSRKAQRKQKLVAVLRKNGLLPCSSASGDHMGSPLRAMPPQDELECAEFKKLLRTEPYSLRAKGLDEKLSLQEFGRVLYHLNQRRGFKTNRKSGDGKDGIVKKEATELQKQIDQSGCRTLGEYFSKLNPHEQQIRGHYTFRSMYEDEFDKLWGKQAEFYPDILSEKLKDVIRNEIIFFQRPLKANDELIGDCELEAGHKRCAKGDYYARRFRMLQDVNNLKLRNPGGEEKELGPEQKTVVLNELSLKKAVTFSELRKKLGLIETQTFNFEQDGKKESIAGDSFTEAMRNKKLFGKAWDEMPEAAKVEINNAVLEMEDEELLEWAKSKLGLPEDKAQGLLKVGVPKGYAALSREAIKKLLPLMEDGLRTDEAIAQIYGPRKQYRDFCCPNLGLEHMPALRNPLVEKALYEIRKIVNAIIREYDEKPQRIYLEMARELKNSKSRREEIHWENLKSQKENEIIRTRLIEDANISKPSREDILKYKLYEECGHRCPYTGKSIGLHELFGQHPIYNIEHILPYSRSLDDSFANKTLCHVDENRRKGNKTPYEFYGEDEELIKRIAVLPYNKRRKFTQKEIELDKCIERQLNDTRYICREVMAYLKTLGVHVVGTRGEATAALRHHWGLNEILNDVNIKNRDDHRHHAVDAVVVALTRSEHLRNLANVKFNPEKLQLEEPWPNFRKEAEEKINAINVSHKVTKKVSGQLHEETNYGVTSRKDEKGQPVYVYRKSLESLTPAMVEKIIDPVVRGLVQERFIKFGNKNSKDLWREPLYMKSLKGANIPIKKVRIADVFNNLIPFKDKMGRVYRAVSSGNNHHVEIFEKTDEKGQIRREGKLVSLFEAARRLKNREPVINHNHGAGTKFIFSLSRNEMFMLQTDANTQVLHRVQKIRVHGDKGGDCESSLQCGAAAVTGLASQQ